MINIQQALTLNGETIDLTLQSDTHLTLNAKGLTVFPGLVDPHVHFRTPGMEHKEDWRTAAKAAIAGGYTTVFDMPNTLPPTITAERLRDKRAIIDTQLAEVGIPLRYHLFFGADKNHFDQVGVVAQEVIGIKVFMGCSTGDLVIDDDHSLSAIFRIAKENNLIVAVHAEDEHLLKERKKNYHGQMEYAAHSEIRNIEVATRAVAKAIALTREYGTRLYILHVSTADEIALIRQAKEEGLPVYAETTPHHLFLDTSSYPKLAGKAVVNPPLRTSAHHEKLFQAIRDGIIDTIGSDHAPHTTAEKQQPYGHCPSGMPGIETTLPLLLNAYHQGFLTLQQIVAITSHNAKKIFGLPDTDDVVLVDLQKEKSVDEASLKTKCGWSSFAGQRLKGWPMVTILAGHCFNVQEL